MKKLGIYVIIFILVIILRDNICFFYGNILGVFKLDNNYYDGIIKLKDEKITYLENEIKTLNDFSSKLERIDYSYKISRIIYKESYNTNKYLIQYGYEDNVNKGLAVTYEYGLIGKISKTNKHISELTILKDIKDLSVLVNNSYGKLNYDYNTNSFIISDISNYDKIHINDEVYTSGYGSIKENVFIGKVTKVVEKDYKKEIYISTLVDFNNLNYVLIVGDFNDNNS